ncbi:MAG: TdeIII family type II restriction endonuclease [Minisyncoccota bacterium]
MTKNTLDKKEAIQSLVRTAVESYATGFQARHEGEVDNPEGTLNMKIHNVFIAALGSDIQYYSALVRSLDSSLGNMLEKLAINIAMFSYEVKKEVQGPLGPEQTSKIADLLEKYKRRELTPPSTDDYQSLRVKPTDNKLSVKRHDSDYYLIDKETGENYLIELKIGGDLDNKKSRSEKEALLEQFAILSNTLPKDQKIKIFFATAYNRYGEDKPWRQERVRQFFADEELLIGRDFWNFVCKSDDGYNIVLDAYKENAHLITSALDSIKQTYLD